ncbi:MAG TPA: element excision factor XisH family protein [Chthonomonadaceae bacterium]|nr:element excision factor XisH family protein [Chthonomonadaceae bacterium]
MIRILCGAERQALYIDLAAEQSIAAEKDGRKIAVEVKSLLGTVEMPELERALGQYVLYRSLIKRHDPERTLFLAITDAAYAEHFDTAEGRDLIADETLKLIVFQAVREEIEQWIE